MNNWSLKTILAILLLSASQLASAQQNIQSVIDGILESMCYVEGGTFTMGATSEQGSDAYDSEKPAHSVTLSSFMICRYEVTQAEWEAVMGTNPSYFKGTFRPVENVSWNDCQEFIKKLNAASIFKFRLPTEAEWEYAARGGHASRGYKYAGGNDIKTVAWYTENSNGQTHDVGTKRPNELGIYDMSGNVCEWCSDWYDEKYYSSSSSTNPKGPNSGSNCSDRGGSWYSNAGACRVAHRFTDNPEGCYRSLGLRLIVADNWHNDALTFNKRNKYQAIVDKIVNNMCVVEGGTFTMGATSEQGSEADSDEKPTHNVTLSSFKICRYEVTQAEWEAVMGSNPSKFKGANRPVEMVSWNDCQEFIKKLNAVSRFKFRLPTEAEWEYAARGGHASRGYKYAGGNEINAVAWYRDNANEETHDVGTKCPNELGIYDMSGNVWEWCSDWYSNNYYSNSPTTNPKGPSSGSNRVYRGGSWYINARYCRVAGRDFSDPDGRSYYLGLRLVLAE